MLRIILVILSVSAFAVNAQTVSNSEMAAMSNDSVAMTAPTNVPKGFSPLAKSYSGGWNVIAPEYGYRTVSGATSLTITRYGEEISQADGLLTFTADGTYTSYGTGGGDECWNWVDAPMQLRWRQSEVIFLIIPRHSNPKCTGQRSFKLVREKSGQLTWRSADGLSSVYYDPK